MSLGFVQNDMKMIQRTGTLNFGNIVADNNRHLLGNDWTAEFSEDPDKSNKSNKSNNSNDDDNDDNNNSSSNNNDNNNSDNNNL